MGLGQIVAINIKAFRLAKGLSQKELADRTKLTVRYISRLENTSPNLTLEILEKLAKGLGVTAAEIVCDNKKTHSEDRISKESLEQTIQLLQSLKSRL